MRKLILLFLMIISMMLLTGCRDDIQIFRKKTDKYAQKQLSDSELVNNVYYVKDGVKFVALYTPEMDRINNSSNFNVIGRNDIAYFQNNIRLVPNAYKGDYIVYKTTATEKKEVDLSRYRYIGYSIGIYGGYFTDEGYYAANVQRNVAKNSSLQEKVGKTQADTIRIVKINDTPIVKDMCDPYTGVVVGLEKGEKYKISYYLGTYYYEEDIVADTAFLNSFEAFSYDPSTREENINGYINFEIPSDLKSGWYYIHNVGFCKYYDFAKGDQNTAETDMNINYYEDEETRILAYSRQYTASVPKKARNMKIQLEYTEDINNPVDTIIGNVIAPSGENYVMDIDQTKREISLELSEAIPGTYKINIFPKSLIIDSVNVESSTEEQEFTQKEKEFTIPADTTNKIFRVYFENNDDVYGTVIGPDGITYNMESMKDPKPDPNTGKIKAWLEYEMPYVSAGTYIVRAYYYSADNEIIDFAIEDNIDTETDVIVIEN